jgi:PAS domain S-box-containing protein
MVRGVELGAPGRATEESARVGCAGGALGSVLLTPDPTAWTAGQRPPLQRQATVIVVIYAAGAVAWIGLSDHLLASMVPETEALVQLGLLKGLAFVAATAGLLLLLLRRSAGTLERAFAAADRERLERVSREAQLQRAQAIIESTDDAIISTRSDGVITSCNPAAEALFGYRAHELVGSSIDRLIPTSAQHEMAAIAKRIHGGERVRQRETTMLRRDDMSLPVSITFSPIWSGAAGSQSSDGIAGVSQIIRDISERKAAEAAADRERCFANGLIEAMPGIFYLYDREGRFLRHNRNFERVSGYTADEVASMHPLDFFDAEEKPLLEARIAEVFTVGEAMVEASFKAKDGRLTPYLFTGKKIVFDGADCLLGVGVNVAERVRAERALRSSEERYRSTLDCTLEGCQLLDFDWRYLYLNDAAALQNRRPNHELLGNRMPDAWPGIETTPVFRMFERCMQERVALHDETEFAFPDGHVGWFDVRVQPVPEGIFILSIEISARKRAERALRELNDDLERKIIERTRALDEAKLRAESADRTKSAFLATMSHELRTPLNSILGFTGIVLQGLAGPLSPEQSKQLGMVRASARHLLDLINDVLDISKIEAGQLAVRHTEFDLHTSIERVVASVLPLAQKKGLALNVRLDPQPQMIESDQRRVEQILLNLLNNAIKFTDRGSVSVSAGPPAVGESSGPRVPVLELAVADTGIGIKEDDLAKLFQPFRQVDSGLQRQHEGTGLGLAICRRLAELLGGSVHVQSQWGRGSRFTLTLPTKSGDPNE